MAELKRSTTFSCGGGGLLGCRPGYSPVRRRATVMLYTIVSAALMFGMLMLAVDWGRVQVARTELMNATTAAARAALVDMASGKTVATNSAIYYGGLNRVDGTSLTITSSDVTVGTWNPTTKVFTANTASPNAVSVTGIRSAARGSAVRLFFGAAIGARAPDLSFTTIATQANDVQVNISTFYNNTGMSVDGVPFSSSLGVGNGGYVLSDTAINGAVTRGSTVYNLSRATTNCVRASGQTIPLPAGKYKSIVLIVAHAYGPSTSTLTLNNGDSTQTTYSQTYSDWCNVNTGIVNQAICGTYSYRNISSGSKNSISCYLLSYEFPITNPWGVTSITLPNSSNMNVFAVGLTPAASITVR